MKLRCCCFTAFKEEPTFNEEYMEYLCYQTEICPETKRKHWQGYAEFKAQLRMNDIKKIFNDEGLHIECRRGTQTEAIIYCKKSDSAIPDSFKEFGTKKKQGERTDWQTLKELLTKEDSPASFKTILDEVPHLAINHYYKIRAIQKLILDGDNLELRCLLGEANRKGDKLAIAKLFNLLAK